jgi:hypothetical protein
MMLQVEGQANLKLYKNKKSQRHLQIKPLIF